MDAALRSRLEQHAGAGVVQADGSVAPASAHQVAAVVRVLGEARAPFTVGSGGTAAAAEAVQLSLARLTGVELRTGALTLRAEAGAPVDALRGAAAAAQLAVMGLPSTVTTGHVGGLVARGEVPRRSIAGIEAVLATGEAVRTGASVLKDVVGYDLPALLLGSMGRLAVIVAVTFRVEPERSRAIVPPPTGVTQPGGGLLAGAFDPHSLLRARGS
jgi:FAD/FMN-containing dehydrogenase